MKAVRTHERDAGVDGLVVEEAPYPYAGEGDVIVRVRAACFTPDELNWPATWVDRGGRARAPVIPGHEVSGEVAEVAVGTTGLSAGQRVVGLTDWNRDGTLAEYVAVEARNLAPLPAGIDHVEAAALPMPGLTAWQGLFVHGGLEAGQSVLVHGAGGGVGMAVTQLARDVGARVIGTGRARSRDLVLELGAEVFLDLEHPAWEEAVGRVDLVFDAVGGDVLDRSAALLRPGGTLVSIAQPPTVRPEDGRAMYFIVEPDRDHLREIVGRHRQDRLRPLVGAVHPLDRAPEAFRAKKGTAGKTVIRIE
ncbi:NADP-dependent oxidoreductase [Streptomyces chromofuscus]|uniref:NADP-dependent oxidoreductase n=1 Tax=Streptomyces chromofuscus TaxID=42881 RepID=A0A7M2T8A0_STRCW|nr:NADP-dependent oxidoreductase [Streptomyces chromofuscus]QOV44890.1 NADP-dependent oxidoreductase [Streptomyces chromofuscus]GGT37027.1 NADPH:quinone reductase [Streptomyces chromofuscus]